MKVLRTTLGVWLLLSCMAWSNNVLALHILDVNPFVIPADGSNHIITVKGDGFSKEMQVWINEGLSSFNFIDEKTISLAVQFKQSGINYFHIFSSDWKNVSSWEKHIIAVRKGEIVTSPPKAAVTGGTVLSIYSVDPAFDKDTSIHVVDSNGIIAQPKNSVFVNSNEMEFVPTSASTGKADVHIDNAAQEDIYMKDAFDFVGSELAGEKMISDLAEEMDNSVTQESLIDPCRVSSISILTSYGGFRRWKANLTGCCSNACNPGGDGHMNFYSLEYRINGATHSTGCDDLASQSEDAEWVFKVGTSHSIGARVVEWHIERVSQDSVERVCTYYSPVVNISTGQISVGNGDSDWDSVSDNVEDNFRGKWEPFFRIGAQGDIPISLPVRIGPIAFRQAAPRVDIMMNYNGLWVRDLGCPGGPPPFGTGHLRDTEPMGYLVKNGSSPNSSTGWQVVQTKTIAHDGTSAEEISTVNNFQAQIFVATRKNALFTYPCDYICNRCSANGLIPNLASHNVGNGSWGPPNSTCGHPDHLNNQEYEVPRKWERVKNHFSAKYDILFSGL